MKPKLVTTANRKAANTAVKAFDKLMAKNPGKEGKAIKAVEKKANHKPDPKRVAAAKLAWTRGKLAKIKAKIAEREKKQAANKKESAKVVAALPKTIKAVEKKMAKAA